MEGIRPVKKLEWWSTGMVICLERDADLHTAQLMPLPLTVSCFSKIQIGFTFLVPAHPGSPEKRAVKRVCVCMSVFCQFTSLIIHHPVTYSITHDEIRLFHTQTLVLPRTGFTFLNRIFVAVVCFNFFVIFSFL